MKENKYYPLTIPQCNMMGVKMCTINGKYEKEIICFYFRVNDGDDNILEKSFNRFLLENDGMRTRYSYGAFRKTKQYIEKFEYENLERITVDDEESLMKKARELQISPDIISGRMEKQYSAVIITCGKDQILFMKVSHICFDGISLLLCANKLKEYYLDYEKNDTFQENNNQTSITKFIDANNQYMKSNLYKNDLKYWKDEFNRHKDIEFPFPKRKFISFAKTNEMTIDGELYESLKQISKKLFIPVSFLITSAIGYTIYELTNCNCFSIAPLTHGRNKHEYENMIGCMNNVFLHFFDIKPSVSKIDYIKQNYIEYLDNMKHGNIPAHKYLMFGIGKAIKKLQTNYFGLMLSVFDFSIVKKDDRFDFYSMPDYDSRANQLYCSIIVNHNDCIDLVVSYQEKLFNKEKMDHIQNVFVDNIKKIIEDCR